MSGLTYHSKPNKSLQTEASLSSQSIALVLTTKKQGNKTLIYNLNRKEKQKKLPYLTEQSTSCSIETRTSRFVNDLHTQEAHQFTRPQYSIMTFVVTLKDTLSDLESTNFPIALNVRKQLKFLNRTKLRTVFSVLEHCVGRM